jgi:hypothetical protein
MNKGKYQLLSHNEMISLCGGAREWRTHVMDRSVAKTITHEDGSVDYIYSVRTTQILYVNNVPKRDRPDQ